ncbi:MAG: hypothetical protein IRZ16_01585 [Myxococcaceae bacterium]|nr:hypothetical protein [Myxococcaceae bacterium]
MTRPPYPPAIRGLLFGLIAACVLGGLATVSLGIVRIIRGADCTGLTPSECSLHREIFVGFARRQLIFGAALSLLGVCVWVLTRERLKEPRDAA